MAADREEIQIFDWRHFARTEVMTLKDAQGIGAYKVWFEAVRVVRLGLKVWTFAGALATLWIGGLERYVGERADDGAALVEVSVIQVGSGEYPATGGHSER